MLRLPCTEVSYQHSCTSNLSQIEFQSIHHKTFLIYHIFDQHSFFSILLFEMTSSPIQRAILILANKKNIRWVTTIYYIPKTHVIRLVLQQTCNDSPHYQYEIKRIFPFKTDSSNICYSCRDKINSYVKNKKLMFTILFFNRNYFSIYCCNTENSLCFNKNSNTSLAKFILLCSFEQKLIDTRFASNLGNFSKFFSTKLNLVKHSRNLSFSSPLK
ncbi:hypothetical protein AGLY_012750 [Aphis glycines]|uniref:Uncharacterized protein n=1 Tax=Aphis glycines TaxID=307491 RepID=A0A6G0T8X1_APHGL|nr:hypothetical protein AGLY_012750 [Aphis glycines]